MKSKTKTQPKTHARASVEAAAPAATLPVPPAPSMTTHFLLRRGKLELVSDLKHLDKDLQSFGGLRTTDTLIYGVLDPAGAFVQRGERIGAEADIATNKIRRGSTGKMALVDELILAGKHTAKQAAEAVVAKFGGDLDKTVVVVRSRPWHLRKSGRLAADAKPFLPAERTRGGTGASPIVRAMLLENKHTADEIVAAVIKATGSDDPKRLKVLVRSMPWHLRKQGLTCGYIKVKGIKPAAKKPATKPAKAVAKAAAKPAKAKRPAAEEKVAKRVGKMVSKMLAAA